MATNFCPAYLDMGNGNNTEYTCMKFYCTLFYKNITKPEVTAKMMGLSLSMSLCIIVFLYVLYCIFKIMLNKNPEELSPENKDPQLYTNKLTYVQYIFFAVSLLCKQ